MFESQPIFNYAFKVKYLEIFKDKMLIRKKWLRYIHFSFLFNSNVKYLTLQIYFFITFLK